MKDNLNMNELNSDDLGKALPFISVKDGKFLIHKESINALTKNNYKSVGLISLVGKYRTGKSFLLNRVLLNHKKSDGFGVAATIRPCTKGIWMYSKPIEISNNYGNFHAFFIDTEGLGAYDEEINHDTKIFLIAMIISSLFIFNSFSAIDEQAITSLSFILNLSQSIKINRNDSKANPDELAKYFPSLLWLLRDFSLKLEDTEGNTITSKQYLENALSYLKGTSNLIDEKNKIRKMINLYFPERDCFTMVRPVEREDQLQNLSNLDDSYIRPEFLRQSEILRNKVFKKVKPKLFNGVIMSGKMIVDLLQNLVDSINDGAIPIIENTWKYILENENAKLAENAIRKYRIEIEKYKNENINKGNFNQNLIQHNKGLIKLLIDDFKFNFVDSTNKNYEEKLRSKLNEEFENFREFNKKCFEKNLKEILQSQWELIINQMKNQTYINNHYQFFRELDEQIEEASSKTPNFEIKNDIIYQNKFSLVKKFIEDVFIKEKNSSFKEISRVKNELKTQLSKENSLKEELIELRQTLYNEIAKYKEEISKLQSQNNNLKQSLNNIKNESLSNEKQVNEDYKEKIKQSEEIIENLKSKMKNQESKFTNENLNRNQKDDINNNKINHLNNMIEALKDKKSNLFDENNRLKQHIEELEEKLKNFEISKSIEDEEKTKNFMLQIETLKKQVEEANVIYREVISTLKKNELNEEIEKQNFQVRYKEILENNKVTK